MSAEIFSGINTAIAFADFCLSLKDAGQENREFGLLIRRVRADHLEALRERNEKEVLLQSYPEKKAWVDGVLRDTEGALFTIGSLIENARVDTVKGRSMTLYHRFAWVLSHKQEFMSKQTVLDTCHRSLLSAMVWMCTCSAPPSYSFAMAVKDPSQTVIKSPYSRRPKETLDYTISPTASDSSNMVEEWTKAFAVRSDPDNHETQKDKLADHQRRTGYEVTAEREREQKAPVDIMMRSSSGKVPSDSPVLNYSLSPDAVEAPPASKLILSRQERMERRFYPRRTTEHAPLETSP